MGHGLSNGREKQMGTTKYTKTSETFPRFACSASFAVKSDSPFFVSLVYFVVILQA